MKLRDEVIHRHRLLDWIVVTGLILVYIAASYRYTQVEFGTLASIETLMVIVISGAAALWWMKDMERSQDGKG